MTDELATLLGKRFIQRRGVKAIQTATGYMPHMDKPVDKGGVRLKWSMDDLRAHIEGRQTFGHYMVGTDDQTKLFAFDIDLKAEGQWLGLTEDVLVDGFQPCNPREVYADNTHPGWEWLNIGLRCMAEGLAIKTWNLFDGEFDVQIAYSGYKGMHVYCFTGPIAAADAKEMAITVLKSFNCFEPSKGDCFYVHSNAHKNLEIEIFPKQGSIAEKDLGNLMKLPLGVHKKTGNRAFFIDPRYPYNELRELDPTEALKDGPLQFWGR